MDPDKIPLGPEAAVSVFIFLKPTLGELAWMLGTPQSFPGLSGDSLDLKMLPNLFQAMGKEGAKGEEEANELLSLICDILGKGFRGGKTAPILGRGVPLCFSGCVFMVVKEDGGKEVISSREVYGPIQRWS